MYGYSIILILIAFFITFFAQMRVKKAYNKYSKVPNSQGLTGAQVCRKLLDANGMTYIRVEMAGGTLSDHYDPKDKVVRLSQAVATQASIASIGIAAHETGHAIQDNQEYVPLKMRNVIYPVCGFGSRFAWPVFLIGLVLGGFSSSTSFIGTGLMNIGILFYCLAVVFYVITLPVEFNASKRALAQLGDFGLMTEEEASGVKKVLNAAAMTYVASALTAILQLIRMLALRNRR